MQEIQWTAEDFEKLERVERLLEKLVQDKAVEASTEPKMRDGRGICSGCGEEGAVLIRHHWWLPGEPHMRKLKHTKMICVRCNMLPSLANGTHILPRWEEQLVMIAGDYREELEMAELELAAVASGEAEARWGLAGLITEAELDAEEEAIMEEESIEEKEKDEQLAKTKLILPPDAP